MSTLDEIAARDAQWDEEFSGADWADDMLRDRRYLLALVREAREALALKPHGLVGPDKVPWFIHTNISHGEGAKCYVCALLARLFEGSDRNVSTPE